MELWVGALGLCDLMPGYWVILRRVSDHQGRTLSRGEEWSDLHTDGFQGIPRSLPVHPHHAVVCAVLGHVFGVLPAPVVPAVGVGGVTAVVPPASAVLPGALFGWVSGEPEEGSEGTVRCRGTEPHRTGPSSDRGTEPHRTGPSSDRGTEPHRTGPSSDRGTEPHRTRPGSDRGTEPRRAGPSSGRGTEPHRTRPGSGCGTEPHRTRPGSGRGTEPHRTGPSSDRGTEPHRTRPGSDRGTEPHRTRPSSDKAPAPTAATLTICHCLCRRC